MQLIQIDPVKFQPLQTLLHALLEIVGTTVRRPFARARSRQSALGRDDESFRIRMERFSDEQFARLRSIGISGVDQVNPELDGATQHLKRIRAIGWPAPNAFTGDPHGSEAEAVHREIAAQVPRWNRSPPGSASVKSPQKPNSLVLPFSAAPVARAVAKNVRRVRPNFSSASKGFSDMTRAHYDPCNCRGGKRAVVLHDSCLLARIKLMISPR